MRIVPSTFYIRISLRFWNKSAELLLFEDELEDGRCIVWNCAWNLSLVASSFCMHRSHESLLGQNCIELTGQ